MFFDSAKCMHIAHIYMEMMINRPIRPNQVSQFFLPSFFSSIAFFPSFYKSKCLCIGVAKEIIQ